jgi:peptidoglycan/LPS O-acetylase OafA/YrhL
MGVNQPKNGGDKIQEFDILRALAILLLILHHGGIYNFSIFGLPLAGLSAYNGLYLLGIFFFLAGYLTVRSLEKHSLKEYLTRRLLRIYIPYLGALFLFMFVLDVNMDHMDLLSHLLGAQMITSPRLTTPILTLWFVGLILVYYALFAILHKTMRDERLLVTVIVVIFVAAGLVRFQTGFITRRFFYYYLVFAAGFLLARPWAARRQLLDKLLTGRFFLVDKITLAAASILILVPIFEANPDELSVPIILAFTFFILAMILLSLSVARMLVRLGLKIPLVNQIAAASFFAYLLHRPVWQIAMQIYDPKTITSLSIYLILIGYLVVLPVAYYVQKIYAQVTQPMLGGAGAQGALD